MGVFDYFTEEVAFDAGTDHLRIIWKDTIVFNEPSRLSLDRDTVKITAIGKNAKGNPTQIVINPVNYVISDFHAFEMLLREAIKGPINPGRFLPKSLISLFSIPMNASEIEKRAYRDSAEHANSKEVYMIHQCCAIAAGLNILFEKKNFIIIDFSAGKFQMTVFIDGMPAGCGFVRLGTKKIIQLVQNYLNRNHHVEASESQTLDILNDFPRHLKSEQVRINGVMVPVEPLRELMQNYFAIINDEVQTALDLVRKDPGLKKALSNGIYFSGGGSLTEYFRNQIRLPEGAPIHVSKTPLNDTVNGLLKVMVDKNKFKDYLMT